MSLVTASWHDKFMAIRSNKAFELSVIAIIIVSALMIGASTYDMDPRWMSVIYVLDTGITIFFLVEIIIRMLAEKYFFNFFKNAWNVFDFLIVSVSLLPIDDSEMVLLARLIRIFRVLRLVSIIPELRVLINSLIIAIPRMGYVLVLMFIIFYIYAAVGSFLFEKINATLWGDISISMLTLFRVSTFEDWTDVMYETMNVYAWSWVYYLTFIFLTTFVFMNMMIGIILDVMQTEHEKMSRETGEGEAGEVHYIKEHTSMIENRLQRIETLLEKSVDSRDK
ncbi:ion transporter [Ghiorsea bivora]|uniref:ion transporter n=1 Tax=Ghiorsea bivora TaxID=1485545 RepID=UPI00056ECCA4|nr:ion transporter [Ghiorsea bivora]